MGRYSLPLHTNRAAYIYVVVVVVILCVCVLLYVVLAQRETDLAPQLLLLMV